MVEVVGDDVAGLAVHIGARVGSLAQAGEILVSSTVKDLVAGSGFTFEDRGTHVLKGVPGEWRMYSAST
jgi:class 3 adenylate cyclase